MRRVVVTGIGCISPLGSDWATVEDKLRSRENAVQFMENWADYCGLNTNLGAPVLDFEIPAHYTRKQRRSMGRVAQMAVCSAEMALIDADLLNDPVLQSGRVGVSYGSSTGSPPAIEEFGRLLTDKTMQGLNATSYVRMMSHTAAVNIGVFFALTGRVITTSSACTAGSQGIGYACEAIRHGYQDLMLAGGGDELCVTEAAVFDTLYATSTQNDAPAGTPKPFDQHRDGLVLGEGAGTLVLEEYQRAVARGAKIYAELVGFASNSDGCHVTRPNQETMARCMQLALENAGIDGGQVGYVNAHGTATEFGDIAESRATEEVFGNSVSFSSLKSYQGHTLGACGALEAWMTIEMMNSGWFAPTINLTEIDPRCGEVDYITGNGRNLDTSFVVSNNFAFGGINTSLVFKRTQQI